MDVASMVGYQSLQDSGKYPGDTLGFDIINERPMLSVFDCSEHYLPFDDVRLQGNHRVNVSLLFLTKPLCNH
jgi:hypothetical protein